MLHCASKVGVVLADISLPTHASVVGYIGGNVVHMLPLFLSRVHPAHGGQAGLGQLGMEGQYLHIMGKVVIC